VGDGVEAELVVACLGRGGYEERVSRTLLKPAIERDIPGRSTWVTATTTMKTATKTEAKPAHVSQPIWYGVLVRFCTEGVCFGGRRCSHSIGREMLPPSPE
jgi:hypothetical protein